MAKLTIEVSAEELEGALQKAYQKQKSRINVPGFRKGKVPRQLIEKMYGPEIFYDDAANALIPEAYSKAYDESGLEIVSQPKIDVTQIEKGKPFIFTAEVATKPEVELGEYKGIEVPKYSNRVTQKEIDAKLEEEQLKNARTITVEGRPVQDKDEVVLDFEGFVDGEAFEGGKGENYSLELGSGSFIPGFEEQVIGMKYEEQKDIVVTFPESYQAKNLAGKEATFKVTLHEIQEKAAAVLDDEFAQKMLPNEENVTIDTLREKIKEQMKSEAMGKYYREELKPAYLETLVERIEFALPNSVVDQEINYALNNKVRSMGEDEIKALQEDPAKVEEIRNELKEDAVNSVKATFIIDSLAKAENIQVSDQEVMQVLYYEAMQMGQNPQEVVKQYQEAGYLPAIKMSMIEEKVISKLLDEKLGK